MQGVYTAGIKISSLSAAKTLMYLTAPSTKAVEILGASVTNASNESNEQCEIYLKKIGTLGTPTATTLTPSEHEQSSPAAGSTVKGNVTASEPSYTSNTELGWQGFSSLGGWFYQPTPEERLTIAASDTWGIYLVNSPTAFDAIVTLTFREIG
jgi:hypothetical protein